MDELDILLGGSVQPGIYRFVGRASSADMLARAARAGWQGWRLNGHSIDSKASFLAACARAMRFPGYFGRNWDAFEECITDLSWQPAAGYLLIFESPYHFAHAAPRDWAMALRILDETAAYWQSKERPFYTILRRTYGVAPGLALLRRP